MIYKLKDYAQLVKFEHTVFALPFGMASVVILYKEMPTLWAVLWILVALVSARTAGMALNRYIDLPIDAINPRTKDWVHASGRVSKYEMERIILISSIIFMLSTYFINIYALVLSPIVLFLVWLYPYSKRFTSYPHFILGSVYFLIPLGVDVALNASVSLEAVMIGLAMASWVSGFDILYALQDYEFDKKHNIGSIPARYGIESSIKIARWLHFATFIFLVLIGIKKMGLIYFLGIIGIAGFLVYEHALIKPNDLSKLDKAFFTTNGFISILFFVVVFLDRVL